MGLPHRFVIVLREIDHCELATRCQRPPGFCNGRLGPWHVMQHHTGDHHVDLAVSDRKVLEITQPEIAAIDGSFSGRLPGQLQHRF